MMSDKLSICVIDGTGAQGSGLALRWARAGHAVTIASRDAAKAAAQELNTILGSDIVEDSYCVTDAAKVSVMAHNLKKLPIDCVVLVTCDDKQAREVGIAIARDTDHIFDLDCWADRSCMAKFGVSAKATFMREIKLGRPGIVYP